jgi:aspartate aminotransferase
MRAEYEARRDRVVAWLSAEPRIRVSAPPGTFYLFPDVSRCLSPSRCATTLEFADELLETEHVVVTAGEAFNGPGHIRLSYATSLDRLQEGAVRLTRFARQIAPSR